MYIMWEVRSGWRGLPETNKKERGNGIGQKCANFKCSVILNSSYARQFGMMSPSALSLLIFFWHGFFKLQLWFFRAKKKEKKTTNTDFLCSGAVIYLARNFIWVKVRNNNKKKKKLLTNIKMSYQILMIKTESFFTFQNISSFQLYSMHKQCWFTFEPVQCSVFFAMFYICIYFYSNLKDYMILLRYMIVFFQNLHSCIPLAKVWVYFVKKHRFHG